MTLRRWNPWGGVGDKQAGLCGCSQRLLNASQRAASGVSYPAAPAGRYKGSERLTEAVVLEEVRMSEPVIVPVVLVILNA